MKKYYIYKNNEWLLSNIDDYQSYYGACYSVNISPSQREFYILWKNIMFGPNQTYDPIILKQFKKEIELIAFS